MVSQERKSKTGRPYCQFPNANHFDFEAVDAFLDIVHWVAPKVLHLAFARIARVLAGVGHDRNVTPAEQGRAIDNQQAVSILVSRRRCRCCDEVGIVIDLADENGLGFAYAHLSPELAIDIADDLVRLAQELQRREGTRGEA
jgi:hypothetical protein